MKSICCVINSDFANKKTNLSKNERLKEKLDVATDETNKLKNMIERFREELNKSKEEIKSFQNKLSAINHSGSK